MPQCPVTSPWGLPKSNGDLVRWEIVVGHGIEKASYSVEIPELTASPDASAGIQIP